MNNKAINDIEVAPPSQLVGEQWFESQKANLNAKSARNAKFERFS